MLVYQRIAEPLIDSSLAPESRTDKRLGCFFFETKKGEVHRALAVSLLLAPPNSWSVISLKTGRQGENLDTMIIIPP